jgi:putative phage-type endonuclease
MSKIKTREQWHQERLKGIGASESSAVLGLNPYMSNIELWQIKTGRVIPEDIGDKPYVKYGVEAEQHLRALFALDFPQYEVSYKDYDLFRNPKHPFIFATLDGRLIEKETGRKGVLEIKTTEILKSMQKESWKDKVPENYYIQNLQQLLATGWDFVILKAQLKYDFDGEVFLQTKHYRIERTEVEEDLEYLQEKEVKFWTKNVLEDKRPDLILPAL